MDKFTFKKEKEKKLPEGMCKDCLFFDKDKSVCTRKETLVTCRRDNTCKSFMGNREDKQGKR